MYVNNDYMQNFNYYNQNPYTNLDQRNNRINNPGFNNSNYQTNGLFYNNMFKMGYMNNQNQFNTFNNVNPANNFLDASMVTQLYPDIYKIVYPIVNNLLSTVNISMIDNTLIDNMTDTVLKILDGECQKQNGKTGSNNYKNLNEHYTENTGNISKDKETDNSSNNVRNNNSNNNCNDNTINNLENQFLKDIIRVIILNELIKLINRFNFNTFLDNIYV